MRSDWPFPDHVARIYACSFFCAGAAQQCVQAGSFSEHAFDPQLFVSGLNWEMDNDGLRDIFAKYGDCQVGFAAWPLGSA